MLSIQHHPTVDEHFDKIKDLTKRDNSFVRRWAWMTLSTMNHPSLQSSLFDCLESEVSTLAKEACAIGLGRMEHIVERPRYRPPTDIDVQILMWY